MTGRRWRWRWALPLVAGVGAIAWFGTGAGPAADASVDVPSGQVTRGEFVDRIAIQGEVKAGRSVVLMAPAGAGDLQIVALARNGATVKKGDVVVEFDRTVADRTLKERQSELRAAEAEIERVRADASLEEEKQLTTVTKARYDVERAKLDVSTESLVSRLEAEQARLALADAEQKVREAEATRDAKRQAFAADLAARVQKREKARFDVALAQKALDALRIRAPVDGVVTLLPNWRAGGPFRSAAEFKVGDRAWAGAPLLELPDSSSSRINGRVDEIDRGRIKVGQAATVTVEAIPGAPFGGQVSEVGIVTRPDFTGWPPIRNFDLVLTLDRTDARLRPGMSAAVQVAVDKQPDAVLMPAQAVFQREGQTVAFVRGPDGFEARPIEVGRRGRDQVVVTRGVSPGDRVALADPFPGETGR